MGITGMDWQYGVMILIALLLVYLSIFKKVEPLLLLPLAFGILVANIPGAGMSAQDTGGVMWFLYQGIERIIYPPLIFLCIGAMTDFGPLLSNPKTAFIGIGGQLGIFAAFGLALIMPESLGFGFGEAASIGIIGSSDGPTAIFTASTLSPDLLAAISIAAYSYMALTPFIQPPIMKLLTTHKERVIVMPQPKRVPKTVKIIFPISVTLVVALIIPAAAPLIGMLMLGNLIRESGVSDRLTRALTGDVLSILTMLIGISIGASARGDVFLTAQTLIITGLGLAAFTIGTIGGVTMAKILNVISGGKINPLIGNAGVSAMPIVARISQREGQKYNEQNHLLMHAMGPIVSSTIGSAIVAGVFVAIFG
ncbi:MAG: sodium ion-translocating decarboxylase subunit beta [Defluviitaleaceae bacterium]|nr:sodium ion-translocating decarboxylase subunit beta [Defluviitaleaceae bacterium]